MDERDRCVLERNRGLLVANVIMTDSFYGLLKTEHVLPDTMIRDVKSYSSREERTARLLDILKLRGGDAYRKFRHVLYLSGHNFIADHLYGEDAEGRLLKADEVFAKFPKLFNHVSDETKAKLLKYLDTKVREKAVTTAWQTSPTERNELMYSRKVLFDAEKDYRLQLETKTKKVALLRDEITRLKEDIKTRDDDTASLYKDIKEKQQSFKEDLAKQSRFNAANNHSLIQLQDRYDSFNERIRSLNITTRRFLGHANSENNNVEDDPDNVKLDLLETNVNALMDMARNNDQSMFSNANEKDAIIAILKMPVKYRDLTVTEIVQQFVSKQDKARIAMARELDSALDVVRGRKASAKTSSVEDKTDFRAMKSHLAVLREEVEHVRRKVEWKDKQISDLIAENSSLQNGTNPRTHRSQTYVALPQLMNNIDVTRNATDRFKSNDKTLTSHVYTESNNAPPSSRGNSGHTGPGLLADVNLERRKSPTTDAKVRKQHRFDPGDIDVLGTSTTYRRSLTDLQSTSEMSELRIK